MRFMTKKSLLSFFLTIIAIMTNCSTLTKSSDKVDVGLQSVLERSNPLEPISIIVVFYEEPTEDQINVLKTVHKMNISHVYKIIYAIAGKAPADEIPKIAEYNWVKEIWLDRKVYATEDKIVEMSRLIDELQRENEELKQAISNLNQEIVKLQEHVQNQQKRISQLERDLKIYLSITFATGFIIGIIVIMFMMKLYRQKTTGCLFNHTISTSKQVGP